MISIQMGTITGYEKSGTLLGLENIQIVQTIIEDDIDATPAILVNPSGDESAPQEGDRVTILKIGNFSLAIGGLDSVIPEADQGEKKLYSKDSSGEIAAFIFLLSSGQMQLNGSGDFAVRFSALETMVSTLNTKFDAHIHPDPSSGSTGPPTVPLSLDISGAKIESIEVPEL